MQKAVFKYRCRRCGTVFGTTDTEPYNGYRFLQEAIITSKPVSLYDVHDCGAAGTGIAELIGCDIEGED